MRIIIVRNTMIIPVGRQGENEAQRIIWTDIVTSWSKLYGDGVFSFAVKRNGDDAPYPAAVTTENGSLVWVPTNADTANVGFGSCELVYTVGDVIAKSQTWRTEVYPSLTGEGETEPPEPYQSWVDKVVAVGAAAQASADAAKADADRAADSATAAQAAQSGAEAAQSAAEQSAQQAAESAAVYDDVVADVTQLKEDVAAITTDDTTVDGKPWTSKKIVDSLCQPIEETGNPVQCYPVENYPLGVKVSWEPVQEGSGDPSPDNIRPINGRDSVTVTRCGENLLDIAQFLVKPNIAYGLAVNVDDTGLIRVFGTPTVNNDRPNAMFRILYTNQVILTKEYNVKWFVVKGVVKEITRIQNDKSIVLTTPLSQNTPVDIQFRFMYYIGTTEPTTYKPYIGHTNTLTLPETVYGGEVDAVNGDGQETWKLLTLDGTEEWKVSGKYLDNKKDWYYESKKIPNAVNEAPQKDNEICSHYPNAYVANTNTEQGCAIVWGAIRVRWGDTIPDDADAWKAYLAAQYAAGTPVQVCYKLAEPVPFTATGTQPIPALSGANTILTDADGVIVTGAEDPKHTITELKNAIISLGGNV